MSAPAGPCANCGTAVVGRYCHACGQSAAVRSKVRDIVFEALQNFTHLDGRLWRTLRMLVLRPGRLTRDWLEGGRIRYVAPLTMYLFAIFLLFAIPGLTGRHLITFDASRVVPIGTGQGGAYIGFDPNNATAVKMADYLKVRLAEDPEGITARVESLGNQLTVLLLPLAMGLLWLVTLRRRRPAIYDHAVVALYAMSMLVFMAAPFTLLAKTPPGLAFMLMGAFAVHLTLHLKTAYNLSWAGSAIRSVVLVIVGGITLLLFLTANLALVLWLTHPGS